MRETENPVITFYPLSILNEKISFARQSTKTRLQGLTACFFCQYVLVNKLLDLLKMDEFFYKF